MKHHTVVIAVAVRPNIDQCNIYDNVMSTVAVVSGKSSSCRSSTYGGTGTTIRFSTILNVEHTKRTSTNRIQMDAKIPDRRQCSLGNASTTNVRMVVQAPLRYLPPLSRNLYPQLQQQQRRTLSLPSQQTPLLLSVNSAAEISASASTFASFSTANETEESSHMLPEVSPEQQQQRNHNEQIIDIVQPTTTSTTTTAAVLPLVKMKQLPILGTVSKDDVQKEEVKHKRLSEVRSQEQVS
jgi:hypothetical protein